MVYLAFVAGMIVGALAATGLAGQRARASTPPTPIPRRQAASEDQQFGGDADRGDGKGGTYNL